MPGDDIEDETSLGGQARKPPSGKLDAVALHGFHFSIEGGHVFLPVIVGKFGQPQRFQHLRAFLWTSFTRIKWDNAPRVQILRPEDVRRVLRAPRNSQGQKTKNENERLHKN